MNRAPRAAGLALLFLVLLALHYSLRPMLAWRAGADFLVIGVLLVAVRVRPGIGALLGAAAGLTADALAPGAFGATTLAMTVVGYSSSWLKAAFFAEQLSLNAFFLFGAKLVFDAVYLIAEQRASPGALAIHLVTWTALSAVVTAFAGLAVLVVFRPFIEKPGGYA